MSQMLFADWTILLPWLMSRGELIGPDLKKSAALIGPDLIRFSPDTNITKSAARLKSLMIA